MTPSVCPNCGEDVPRRAKACPHCGACEKNGWAEDADAPVLTDLPEDGFDYDEYVRREFGDGETPRDQDRKPLWLILVVIILAAMILSQLF